MHWFDSHCHLDLPELHAQAHNHWAAAREAGVQRVLIPGVDPAQWASAEQLAVQLPGAYWAAGVHPWWVGAQTQAPEMIMHRLREALTRGAIAVGECGLDGAIDVPMGAQQSWLRPQLEVAADLTLPVILHVHRAHNPILAMLKPFPHLRGVVHGFSGSIELALQYIKRGFLLGIGGVVSYPRASKTRAAVAALPQGSFLLETDAPSMPVFGSQGEINTPSQLLKIANSVAELRGESLAQLHAHTERAAQELFGPLS
ncbi:TatD family hydrolase [Simiduia aestuariiviva]|uniref:TatD DNase family protein n=1 Tax=Simiduia aestuariiviva TaxID=1510459 RepID=A0A839UVR1_9GAMM|nr:TatD family hydrolase [Simiduia aestuariiviva]MBB3169548.1 TatD DNase family protein [Simiduia aestuariiviva]